MFADAEVAPLDASAAYQPHHQPSTSAGAAYERCYTSAAAAVLMHRPSYADVAATAPFYPLDDLAPPCSVLSEHQRRTPSYSVYDRSYVDAPPSSFLYNAAAATYDCAFGGCPDCLDAGYSSATPTGGRSPAEGDEDATSTALVAASSSTLARRSSSGSSARKRALSQAELERRRSLANHQERRRMHRLNSALDRLRSAIPPRLQNGSRRLSKIKTLKMAINYIVELQTVLGPTGLSGGGGVLTARSWN
ncbi:uncharacterized protein LOC144098684 [Amblyomma americanum]